MLVMPFVGLSGGVIARLDAHTVESSVVDPVNATATLTLNNTGILSTDTQEAAESFQPDEWMQPPISSLAGQFESRATVTSGTLTTGSDGVWEALDTTRTWTKTQSVVGLSDVVFTLEIRTINGSVTASAEINLIAEVSP